MTDPTPDPITDEELAAWQAMIDAATPEPWVVVASRDVMPAVVCQCINTIAMEFSSDADAQVTATSRSAMPRLIAELLRVRAQAAEYRAMKKKYMDIERRRQGGGQ